MHCYVICSVTVAQLTSPDVRFAHVVSERTQRRGEEIGGSQPSLERRKIISGLLIGFDAI